MRQSVTVGRPADPQVNQPSGDQGSTPNPEPVRKTGLERLTRIRPRIGAPTCAPTEAMVAAKPTQTTEDQRRRVTLNRTAIERRTAAHRSEGHGAHQARPGQPAENGCGRGRLDRG